ncbi:hypothetical protein ABPG74_016122 [Tetrahymena malaccensis]
MRCPSHIYNNNNFVPEKCQKINYWYHADCGGESQIYSDITLRCSKCSKQDHLKNWKFRCSDTYQYQHVKALSFTDAFTQLLYSNQDVDTSLEYKLKLNEFITLLLKNSW